MSTCLIVSDDAAVAAAVRAALSALDVRTAEVGAGKPFDAAAGRLPAGFEPVATTLERAERAVGPVDALVVKLGHTPVAVSPDASGPDASGPDPGGPAWRRVLDAHATVEDQVVGHAAWARAGARLALSAGRPVRIVHLVNVTGSAGSAATAGAGGGLGDEPAGPVTAGETTGQAVAQLARSSLDPASNPGFSPFSVLIDAPAPADHAPLGALVARLVWAQDTLALAGAELVVTDGWVGLRRHPGPGATLTYPGPAVPGWANRTLRGIATAGA